MMKKMTVFMFVCVLFSCTDMAAAGIIYGTLQEGVKPIAKVPMSISDPTGRIVNQAITSDTGSYQLNAKGEGKRILTVEYNGEKPKVDITSYPSAIRYDLILVKENGVYILKRK
jgi:hypothetical protein